MSERYRAHRPKDASSSWEIIDGDTGKALDISPMTFAGALYEYSITESGRVALHHRGTTP
jgi:hypothetical protein